MRRTVGVLDRTDVVLAPVRRVAREQLGDPEVLDLGRPDGLAEAPPVDLLVLGPKELTSAGLKRLASWRTLHPDAEVVAVGVAPRQDAEALRAAGVLDVARHLDDVEGLLLRSFSVAVLPHAAQEDEVDPHRRQAAADLGLLLTVSSATGGCGKTFFSTNLAAHAAASGLKVLLVDLDLQFGEVAAALQIRHPYSIYDGLYDGAGDPVPDDTFVTHLDELVYASALGFDVLVAPRDPALADSITSDDVGFVLDVVQGYYDLVVVDTPPQLSDVVLTSIDRSEVICVLTTLDVPSLRNLTAFLEIMRQLKVGDERIRMVLNKVEPDIGIDVSQAQDAFAQRFVAEIPAARAASRSINTGTVVMQSEPRSPIARSLLKAVEAVVPSDVLPRSVPSRTALAPGAGGSASGASVFRKLFRPRTAPGGTS